MAYEAVAHMEAELAQLQSLGDLSAINRSVQNDTAAAQAEVPAWHVVFLLWLDGSEMIIGTTGTGCWRNRLAILYRISVITLSTALVIIGPRLADTIRQLCDRVSKGVKHGERLIVGPLRHLLAAMLR